MIALLAYCVLCGEPTDEALAIGPVCEGCQADPPRHSFGAYGRVSPVVPGRAFGALRVESRIASRRSPKYRNPNPRWRVVCSCGRRDEADSRELLGYHSGGKLVLKTRCTHCRCESQRGAAALVAWAVPGKCSWCQRSASTGRGKPQRKPGPSCECAACERAAVRNGRDSTGRPVAKGKRRVLSGGVS